MDQIFLGKQNIPAGCDVKVYASVDGSTFQECENNAPIPSLSEGVSLVDKVLTVKESVADRGWR